MNAERSWPRKRLAALAVASIVCGAIAAIGFLVTILGAQDAGSAGERFGQFWLGPSLLVLVLIGVAGAVRPDWWTAKRSTIAALVGFTVIAGQQWERDQRLHGRAAQAQAGEAFKSLMAASSTNVP